LRGSWMEQIRSEGCGAGRKGSIQAVAGIRPLFAIFRSWIDFQPGSKKPSKAMSGREAGGIQQSGAMVRCCHYAVQIAWNLRSIQLDPIPFPHPGQEPSLL